MPSPPTCATTLYAGEAGGCDGINPDLGLSSPIRVWLPEEARERGQSVPSDGNKKSSVAVFLGVASVNLPTTIEQRSSLFAGSMHPGRPVESTPNITKY
jgi:hypothetical protein